MRIPARPHPRRLLGRKQGFTLPELVVAMAMTGIIVAAVYATYKPHQDAYIVQDQVVEMQQNLRAALYMMAEDIRLAGYNPRSVRNLAGFVAKLPAPNDGEADAKTDGSHIALTTDAGTIGTNYQNGVIDTDDREQAAYRLDPTGPRLQRFSVQTRTWVTVADDIEGINFVYLDGGGNVVVLDPTNATTFSANVTTVRTVQITIVARARSDKFHNNFSNPAATVKNPQGDNVTKYDTKALAINAGDTYRRRILTTAVQCRNMGL